MLLLMPKHKSDNLLIDLGIFVVTLFAANIVWKLSVDTDEAQSWVTIFGNDVTGFYDYLSEITTAWVYNWVHVFRDTIHVAEPNILYFDSGSHTRVAWSCVPIKQAFIWLCLILTTRGGWIHKSWYIPTGWVVIWFFNILRIGLICLFIEFHPIWFNFLHVYVFKYLFYGVMFLMWLLFVNKVAKRT